MAVRQCKSVRELLSTTDARELQEWKIYNKYHPLGDDREDARFALVCRTIANSQRVAGGRAFTIHDFMPDYGRDNVNKPLSQRQLFMLVCPAKGIEIKTK